MRSQTRAVVLMLAACLVGVQGGVGAAAQTLGPGGSFVDDDGHPAEASIEAAVAAGLIDGCDPVDPERFCPTSRASWTEVESGISRLVGRATELSCAGLLCSAVSVPVSVAVAALPAQSGVARQTRTETPITRAGLAHLLATAGELDTPEVPVRRSLRIALTGDILLHAPVIAQAARNGGGEFFDFGPMFMDIAPVISATDLSLCHLETPLTPDNADLSSYPVFSSPGRIAEAIAEAGYDGCSTASNHSFDRRTGGILSTLELLEAAGLGHAGTTDLENAPAWWIYEVEGVRIAHLAYTYGLNGFRLPADQPWLVNLIDEERILADAVAVRELGAEFVLVSLHWGNEYQSRPTAGQHNLAGLLLSSPEIDAIVGHHAHVVQGVELLNDKFVLYGLGNLISNQIFSLKTQDGVIAILEVVESRDGFSVEDIEFVPTRVERGSFRIVPIPLELDLALDSQTRWSLEQSWNRTAATLSMLDESVIRMVAPTG